MSIFFRYLVLCRPPGTMPQRADVESTAILQRFAALPGRKSCVKATPPEGQAVSPGYSDQQTPSTTPTSVQMSASITDALASAPVPDNVDITKDATVLSSENTDAQHAERAQKITIPHSARSYAAAEALDDASPQDTSDNMKDQTVPHVRGPNARSVKQTLMTTLQFAKHSLIGTIRRSQPPKEYAVMPNISAPKAHFPRMV